MTAAVTWGLVLIGSAAPAWADEPAQPAAPDTKSSAPADAPSTDSPPTAAAKPTPVPHLSSLNNLPPYTTTTEDGPQDPDRLSYLKDVWHAYQDHDITPSQALVLLAQRPMDADAAPPPGLPAGPQAPGPVPGPPPATDASPDSP
ncbi:hypothetical protein [Mycobacterium sp. MAA66]|uniref:hypothetical protein n=1 Tax=Mycobacterium sp. MAA66 TaxID=3156297 RepID=UPI003510FA9C